MTLARGVTVIMNNAGITNGAARLEGCVSGLLRGVAVAVTW